MNTKPKSHIDGMPGLLAFAKAYHPRHEHSIVDLEKLLRRIGFEVTDSNEDRIIVAGPLRTATACRTLVRLGGRMNVRHFELIKALERLLEVGLPVWKTEAEQFEWHLRQLEQCAPFQISAHEEFETRADLEQHVGLCDVCKPASKVLIEAIDSGSSRYTDEDLRDLIAKSHADQAEAVRFYTQIRDAMRMSFSIGEKPNRARRTQQEVTT